MRRTNRESLLVSMRRKQMGRKDQEGPSPGDFTSSPFAGPERPDSCSGLVLIALVSGLIDACFSLSPIVNHLTRVKTDIPPSLLLHTLR